tara:strand:+ start:61 stop:276 length:216 start_codon:yes stop_codon:yes gene_type:complete
MTQEIIEMAVEAGIPGWDDHEALSYDHLEAFAKLVAAAEREACAQIVNDDRGLSDDDAIRVCRAIKARGQA